MEGTGFEGIERFPAHDSGFAFREAFWIFPSPAHRRGIQSGITTIVHR